MRSILAGALALVLAYVVTGASEADAPSPPWKAPPRAAATKNPIPSDNQTIAIAKSLYAKECAACHGDTGRGNGPDATDLSRPPTDFTTPATKQQSDGELFWKLSEGRRPMPRFQKTLSDEQRWHLINYLRTLQK